MIMGRVNSFGLIYLLINLFNNVTPEPLHGYVTHYYYNRKPIFVNDSMVLELTNRLLPSEPDKDYLACDVTVMTSPGRKLLVHFLALRISDESSIDRLHIFDVKDGRTKQLTPAQGLYGLYDEYYRGSTVRLQDYISSKNSIKLNYQGKPTLAFDGFKILLTSVKDTKSDCGRGYVRCSIRTLCIPATCMCDGYSNCGRIDSSDEDGCSDHLRGAWQPIDGTVTAVVVASVASGLLIIAAVLIFLVITKINRREIAKARANVTVEFRKRKSKNNSEHSEHLKKLYAPPSYEVVIGMDEDPPPYCSVAEEYNTESDDDSILNKVIESSSEQAQASTSGEHNSLCESNMESREQDLRSVTEAQIVCDIEGNTSTTDGPKPEKQNGSESSEFINLTKYRLCSSAIESSPKQKSRKVIVKGASDLDEIEVLPSEDCDSFTDTETKQLNFNNNIVKNKHSNGHVGLKHNGVNGHCNGHAVVKYKRSPSKRDAASIDFIDSD